MFGIAKESELIEVRSDLVHNYVSRVEFEERLREHNKKLQQVCRHDKVYKKYIITTNGNKTFDTFGYACLFCDKILTPNEIKGKIEVVNKKEEIRIK